SGRRGRESGRPGRCTPTASFHWRASAGPSLGAVPPDRASPAPSPRHSPASSLQRERLVGAREWSASTKYRYAIVTPAGRAGPRSDEVASPRAVSVGNSLTSSLAISVPAEPRCRCRAHSAGAVRRRVHHRRWTTVMERTSTAQVERAKRLLALEGDSGNSSAECAAAAWKLYEKLNARLAPLLGSAGVQALFVRSAKLAQAQRS